MSYLITALSDIEIFCYANTALIQTYLPPSFSALSIPKPIAHFNVSSWSISEAFELTNGFPTTMMPELQYLLASKIDVVIYQGNLDLTCNTAGAKSWTANMAWKGQAAFAAQDLKP
jgi:cathepsin A (carboxypeptidase C)